MKHFIILLLLSATLFSCQDKATTSENTNSENKDFTKLLDDYYESSLVLYPLSATFNGDNRFNDLLPNHLSPEFQAKEKAFYTAFKNRLDTFKDEDLSKEEQMSKAVLAWDLDIALEQMNFREDLIPIDQLWSFQFTGEQLASGQGNQPFNTIKDYNNWLSRLDGYLAWMKSAEDNMRTGIELGYVLPKSLIKKVIPPFETMATTDVENHLFYQPISKMPETFTDAQKDSLTQAYKTAVQDKVIPTYTSMYNFLKTDYLAAGRATSGVSDIPNGEAYYNFQIKKYTTTNLTADEIYTLGLLEVERISAEMEKVKQEVGYEGDLKSFFNYVRDQNPDLMPYTDPQQAVDQFNTIYETMKPQIEVLFDKKPETPFEIRRTEAYREASTSAEYHDGNLEANRPGIFYVPVPNVEKYNVFYDEALFLHEAIPGHHYQISMTQENPNLPEFRKNVWNSAYGEGWALYTESLGKELGLYTDPYQYFGMLTMEMHRAIRLVVDVGMHVKGWSRERAIQYSLDNEAEMENVIISDVERYMSLPGQALSYKIGQLKIMELRNKCEAAFGADFDIKEFHNRILETGCIPLALLDKRINDWIEED